MLRYILIRIGLFVPTFLIISLFAFFLYRSSPGDPVVNLLELRGVSRSGEMPAPNYDREYRLLSSELGFDRPAFYFRVVPSYFPDTLHQIIKPDRRRRALQLLQQHQQWVDTQSLLSLEKKLNDAFDDLPDSIRYQYLETRRLFDLNQWETEVAILYERTRLMNNSIPKERSGTLEVLWPLYQVAVEKISSEDQTDLLWPKLKWAGLDNQFHFWFSRMVRGDFGYSLLDGRQVSTKLFDALAWTFTMIILAIVLSFLFSIPIGVYCAKYKNSWFDRVTSIFLYVIYGFPVFWMATLLVVFFTTEEYGSWTDIFPPIAMNFFGGGDSVWTKIAYNADHLILPIFCLTLQSMAYLSRQTRAGMIEEFNKPYTLTAFAKGLKPDTVLWKHNFPNTLIALVTILFGAIPGAFAGSLVIEVIFNIPGMGRLMFQSIFNDDWPVLFSGLLLFGAGTMLSYLAGDIVYGILHPGIQFKKR